MAENIATDSQTDIRILTLKRWNFPQTAHLFPTDGKEIAGVGDYISYNSHHFIHIEECLQTEEQPILRAYSSLEKLRGKQRDVKAADIHVIQSITLLGEKGHFWDTPGEVLYISFLQLTNTADISMDEIRGSINSVIMDRAPAASWALYYSLDFCDLVLFTKGLTYEDCSKIMWDLSIVRGDELAILRDTFTIYGFYQGFLKEVFKQLDQNQYPKWKDHASLSIQLSIQSYDVWRNFEKCLKRENIPYRSLRTFGRYDVRLVTDDLPGRQVLLLLYLMDTIAGESKDRAFGGYEISMEAVGGYENYRNPVDTIQDRRLEQAAANVMDLLCGLCDEVDCNSADYVDETRRSLEALLNNGFSEEFVLSVLPSFLAFLQITINVQDYRDRMRLKQDEEDRLKESLEKMVRHYFNALNILALCTMHSERQFVQAPAFNATFFDVPPKLLAFYSAVSWEILAALRAENDADYHFLFVPNYQKDINIRPLELKMNENPSQHLAVAHLHESYFYDPVLTIKLFCHEAAHYLSDRHREDRAKYIFRVVSFLLIANTPLRFVMEEAKDYSLFAVMADSLANFMLKKYAEEIPNSTRGIPYHLKDVSEFLRGNNYGMDFFKNPFDTHEVCVSWKNVLRESVSQKPDVFGESFRIGLRSIQKTLRSNYLIELFQQDQEGTYVYEVFSRIIADYASFTMASMPDEEFNNICENIIQAFSEAYADLRMSELIGEEFSWRDYNDMFTRVDVDKQYQKILRHDAVLKIMTPNDDWKTLIPKDEDFLISSYIVEQICEYLELCHAQPTTSDQIVQLLRDFKECNVSKQCGCIRETIQKYRIHLTRYCQNLSTGYSSRQ